MKHSLLTTTLTTLCLAALPLTARAADDKPKDRLGFSKVEEGEHNGVPDRWTCIIGGSDNAITSVRLSAITSISKQTYMLEGAQKVLEVTIDTTGNNSIRFYCLVASERLNRVGERTAHTRELVDKHTERATRYPAKKYPEATHSHNIEYQLSSPEQVNRIYESVMHAWVKGVSISLSFG